MPERGFVDWLFRAFGSKAQDAPETDGQSKRLSVYEEKVALLTARYLNSNRMCPPQWDCWRVVNESVKSTWEWNGG